MHTLPYEVQDPSSRSVQYMSEIQLYIVLGSTRCAWVKSCHEFQITHPKFKDNYHCLKFYTKTVPYKALCTRCIIVAYIIDGCVISSQHCGDNVDLCLTILHYDVMKPAVRVCVSQETENVRQSKTIYIQLSS